jgi:O-antigen ligase
MNGLTFLRPRADWFSASNLFAAGLFCLFVGIGGGAKPVAVGQAFVFLAIVKAFFERGPETLSWRSLPPSAWSLVAFVLVSALSVFANWPVIAAPFEHLGKLRYLAVVPVLLAMPWLMRGLLPVPWRRDSLVLAWIVPLAFAISIGLIAFATGTHPLRGGDLVDIRRVSGLYGQVMTFAYSLQFSVVALAAFFIAPRVWKAITSVPWWIAVAMLLLGAVALYFTYTRGAMLGAVAGVAVLAMRRSWKLGALVALIGIAGVTLLALKAGREGGAKRDRGPRYLQTDSDIRLGQWRAASLSFLERPVLGWGYRNFELQSAALKERYGFEKDVVRKRGQARQVTYFQGHAHNNILESFASMGVVGGLAFLAFVLLWLREAWRSRYGLFLAPPIVAFLVSGMFENTFFDSEVLNCLLLLYLITQWVRVEEGEGRFTAPEPALPPESLE